MTAKEQSLVQDTESKPVCGAKNRGREGHCKRPAGWGTHHVGVGVCKLHGGSTPIKTDGSRSKYLQHDVDIQARVKELKESQELMDLRGEIAITIAMMERAVEKIDKNDDNAMDSAKSVSVISTNLARVVEIKHKIEIGHWLSPEHVQEEIQRAAAHIQRSCSGCDKLPQLAADFQGMSEHNKQS